MRRARARLLAFTLLEVLAAVAILALVYTVLARVGIQGFHAEGASDRRLRASLIADELMAEIEGQLAMGSAPPLGEKDAKRDEYLIHMRVTPSEIEIPPPSEAAAQRLQAILAKRSTSSAPGAKAGSAGPMPSFFEPPSRGEPPPGRRIELRVSWTEGITESAVVRETYGLDQTAAGSLLLALDSAAQAERQAAAGAVPGAQPTPGAQPQPGGQPQPGAQSSPMGTSMGPGPVPPGMGLTP